MGNCFGPNLKKNNDLLKNSESNSEHHIVIKEITPCNKTEKSHLTLFLYSESSYNKKNFNITPPPSPVMYSLSGIDNLEFEFEKFIKEVEKEEYIS